MFTFVFLFHTICSIFWGLTLYFYPFTSGSKVIDLTVKISKGHWVFINSLLENFLFVPIASGGRGSMNNFLCPYSSCPFQAMGGGGWELDQCLLLSNFFWTAPLIVVSAFTFDNSSKGDAIANNAMQGKRFKKIWLSTKILLKIPIFSVKYQVYLPAAISWSTVRNLHVSVLWIGQQ